MTTKTLGQAREEWNERAVAILECPEGLANPTMARELAFRQTMDASAAVALLKLAPPEKGENPYLAAMAKHGPVGIAGPQSAGLTADAKAARQAEIKRNMAAFNGHGRRGAV